MKMVFKGFTFYGKDTSNEFYFLRTLVQVKKAQFSFNFLACF